MSPHEQQGRESVRTQLERHFTQAWRMPTVVIFFRTRRFRLDYPGRSNFGVMSVAGKVAWTLCLPFFAIYVVIGSILSEVGINVPALEDKETVKPGTVRVLGMAETKPATSLIDALRRGRRGGWLVLARGRTAFVKAAAPKVAEEPAWACADGSVTVSLNTDHHDEIHFSWSRVARASLYLDPAECALALRQIRKFV